MRRNRPLPAPSKVNQKELESLLRLNPISNHRILSCIAEIDPNKPSAFQNAARVESRADMGEPLGCRPLLNDASDAAVRSRRRTHNRRYDQTQRDAGTHIYTLWPQKLRIGAVDRVLCGPRPCGWGAVSELPRSEIAEDPPRRHSASLPPPQCSHATSRLRCGPI